MPNIVGYFNVTSQNRISPPTYDEDMNPFYYASHTTAISSGNRGGEDCWMCMDLSRYDNIYGSSTTVTPLSIGTTFYIKYS